MYWGRGVGRGRHSSGLFYLITLTVLKPAKIASEPESFPWCIKAKMIPQRAPISCRDL